MSRAVVVAQRVQIRVIRLVELVCHNEVAEEQEIMASLSASTEAAYCRKSQELLVTAHCAMVGSTSDKESAVRVEAIFQLLYDLPPSDDMTQLHFDAFGEINGLFNLWPFWRELVQNMTVRMGLPPLTLPVRRGITLPTSSDKSAATNE
jgi:preprotein translocase subunit SecB